MILCIAMVQSLTWYCSFCIPVFEGRMPKDRLTGTACNQSSLREAFAAWLGGPIRANLVAVSAEHPGHEARRKLPGCLVEYAELLRSETTAVSLICDVHVHHEILK